MKTIKYNSLLFISLCYIYVIGIQVTTAQIGSADEVTYVGAVLEYAPYDTWTDEGTGLEIILTNTKAIISYAEQAKAQFADIFVVPEYGVHSLNTKREFVWEFLTFTQYVPTPEDDIIPCDLPKDTSRVDSVRLLSCAASTLKMYLVIDFAELSPCNETIFDNETIYWSADEYESCPESGYYAYNTQAVFDRQGKIIARYRKQHLFLEDMFTPGPRIAADTVFYTDFNVLFSLQICFDIVYETPGLNNVKYGGVRDIAMSTAWVDELPFHLADAVQNGVSRGLEINLLVAGYHNPFRSKTGSGIYRGYKNELPNYVYDKNAINVLLVSTITTRAASSLVPSMSKTNVTIPIFDEPISIQNKIVYDGIRETSIEQTILQLDMSNFNTVYLDSLLPGESKDMYECSENFFCCNMTYQYSGDLTYAFTVFSGQFTEGGGVYRLGLQICGIIYCTSDTDIATCGHVDRRNLPESDKFGPFEITSSSFSAVDIFPMGLERDLSNMRNDVLLFDFATASSYKLYTEHATDQHFSAALYGRWYANDP